MGGLIVHTTRSISVFVIALFLFVLTVVQWPRQGTAWQANTTVAVVSAGNYQAPVTPDSIAALFGVGLSAQTDQARTRPLPTTLAGVTVRVNNVATGLFFVSPGQINFLIPAGTALGTANISVTASDGTARMGTVEVANTAPALFTFNGNGQGVAAALALRVRANNTQSYEPIAQLDAASNRWQAVPLNLGAANERLFLVMYASGTRGVASLLRVLMGGVEITPSYVGASADFFGVEQINVELTRSLIGRGRLNLSLIAPNTRASNVAEIDLANVAADVAGAPVITSIAPAQAVAGETLTITGTGFSTAANGNAIIIGGVETRTVESVTATRIVVRVPFGVGSSKLAVRTALGEGLSANPVNALTTVSGVITDTQGNPLPNVAVSIAGRNATTSNNGNYTVKDVPANQAVLRVDPTALPLTPKLPVYQRLVGVLGNRDNLQPVIALQPPDNTSVQTQGASLVTADDAALAPEAITAAVTNGGITFDTSNSVSTLPTGVTDPRIYLTRVENSRAPASLPRGVFSSALAQLSPFGIRLNPGGKLTFPNPDGWAANSQVTLYRLNQTATSSLLGTFVTAGTATVSADGQRIETAANAITETSIYFVANARPTTTVIGRVVDSDNTPVRNALVVCAGQLALTDGNGSFVITSVPVTANAQLSLEASFIRASGRTDRVTRTGITALAFSTTRITPDLVLPSPATQPNRPPSLTAPAALTVNVSTTTDFPLLASDPDNQAVTVTVTGTAFASIVTLQGFPNLRLAPGATAAGNYTLTLRATDSQNGVTTRTVALTVIGNTPNRPPVLTVPTARTVAAGQVLAFDVTATDPDAGQTLRLTATGLPTGANFSQTNATTGRFTWTPNANQVVTVSFSVSDGSLTDTKAVMITVSGGGDPTQWVRTSSLPNNVGGILHLLVVGSNIFVGTFENGMLRSTDNGASWAQINNGFPVNQLFIYSLVNNGATIFASTAFGIFRSTDNGANWVAANNGIDSFIVSMPLMVSGTTLFASIGVNGVFRSTDNGANWTRISDGLNNTLVTRLAANGANLFASTSTGVYRSTNGGVNWTAVNNGLGDQFIIDVLVNGTTIFAVAIPGLVFRSTDNGANWTLTSNGLPEDQIGIALAISGTTLFYGNSFGVYRSTNNGASWTAFNEGLTLGGQVVPITSFAVAGNTLYGGNDTVYIRRLQ